MYKTSARIAAITSSVILFVTNGKSQNLAMTEKLSSITTGETVVDNKLVIYQMLVRLFGNKNSTNKYYGSIRENGVGKFNDITDKALDEIKKLGVSHIWYTGVIEHATMTDYTARGIKYDDPDVVKGKAGSPYAVKDYYDVDPDLSIDVTKRMAEFEALIERTHSHGLKALIDFVPNHVARTYYSDARPAGVKDFGEGDDTSKAFDPKNDFYYIPSQPFVVPAGTDAGGGDFSHPMKDGKFDEYPAKATGNDIFSAKPGITDWYETIKLNYGVDYQNGKKTHFNPIPPVWSKMRDILIFWAKKNIDGFRCDVAELVPVEFWSWVIPQVKVVNPKLIFIGEAYDPKRFKDYLTTGKFDFLYDKVGLYDALKRLIKDEPGADIKDITHVWKEESRDFSSYMLRFLENHDEERIASAGFAKDARYAKPAMVISATLASGPVMLYFGQEVGEPGMGKEGFGGEDNRTTIFDYWGVPEHQKWLNDGKFDGAGLSKEQHELRNFYIRLLNLSATNKAIRSGNFYELSNQPIFNRKNYAFLRHAGDQRILVVANFDRTKTIEGVIRLPDELYKILTLKSNQLYPVTNLLTGETLKVENLNNGIGIKVPPSEALILAF
jgi:glycosidase